MRKLSNDEQLFLSRRRANFDLFLAERMPVLTEFIQLLELNDPTMVLVRAESYAPALDEWLQRQTVEPDDWMWLMARLGYFVGEYLVQKYNGCWFLNEDPDSRYFGRYAVGQFLKIDGSNAMVDPFEFCNDFLKSAPIPSLMSYLSSLEAEIEVATSSD